MSINREQTGPYTVRDDASGAAVWCVMRGRPDRCVYRSLTWASALLIADICNDGFETGYRLGLHDARLIHGKTFKNSGLDNRT